MNRFIIVDGLPYLFAKGRSYAVKLSDKGFTIGDEVKKASSPYPLYTQREVIAKCKKLDSISATSKPKTRKKSSSGDSL